MTAGRRRFPPRPLTQEQASALIASAGASARSDWYARREQCALVLMYRCGCRVSEVLGLDMGAIRADGADGMGAVLRVDLVKGWARAKNPSPPREWSLDPGARAVVMRWLAVRGLRPGPLICTHGGGRLESSHYRRLVPRLARRAGIPGRVHPHGLRHTFACELYRETRDVYLVMRALGHRSLATTQRYLEGLGVGFVAEYGASRRWEVEL